MFAKSNTTDHVRSKLEQVSTGYDRSRVALHHDDKWLAESRFFFSKLFEYLFVPFERVAR